MRGEGDWRAALDLALAHERLTALPDLDLSPSAVAADIYRLSLELDVARVTYERLRDLAVEQQDVRIEILGDVRAHGVRLPSTSAVR